MTHETFESFVRRQPSDRVIHHWTWQSCAVGDYLRESQEFSHDELDEFVLNNEKEDLVPLLGNDEVLYESLNNHGMMIHGEPESNPHGDRQVCDENMDGETVIKTYGDLQSYFDGNLVIIQESDNVQ